MRKGTVGNKNRIMVSEKFVAALCTALYLCLALPVSANEPGKALARLEQGVKVHTLSNGLRILTYRRGAAPVFAGVVAVRVGGSDERPGATGISHLLEHMAFKGTTGIGTRDYGKEKKLLDELEQIAKDSGGGTSLTPEQRTRWGEIQEELSKLWKSEAFTRQYKLFGADGMNAFTSKDFTVYKTRFPRSAFKFWCWMESERIVNPVMRQFYKERDVVMEERRMRYDNDPGGLLYENLLSIAYKLHPYRHPVIGYPGDLRGLTASQTDNFRKKYYVGSNITVAVVGDVYPEQDLKELKKCFGRIPAGIAPPRPSIIEPPQEQVREVTINFKGRPQIMVAYHKPVYPHPDDPALSVMEEAFAGSRLSPLYRELVEKRKIASSVDVWEAPGNAYPNLIVFSADINAGHNNREFIRAFDDQVTRFKEGKFSADLIKFAKKRISMNQLTRIRSSMSLAIDLSSAELLYPQGWTAVLDWYTQALAVDRGKVISVAKKYLNPFKRTIAKID